MREGFEAVGHFSPHARNAEPDTNPTTPMNINLTRFRPSSSECSPELRPTPKAGIASLFPEQEWQQHQRRQEKDPGAGRERAHSSTDHSVGGILHGPKRVDQDQQAEVYD